MATIKKLIQDAPRMRGVTPVPNGPLIKKKGEFKGSTLKAGGWIKKAAASIKRRGTEGVCTGSKFGGPTCKPGSKRYNLAKVFKGIAKKRKG